VGIRMGMSGVQFSAQLFDEGANRITHVRNRGIHEAVHETVIIPGSTF
jgi:hypothetical protein